ncbi:pyruvate dehydrogenase (acetyl-transferring) E1 component, alpha subunit [Xylanimonas cellulosilytica DSM 15894]|uniref:Pyruvate dehydrogenase (Acetyl-transferring) E1 component, alpha subunit n=1 Tax=Xylanimonas cellulosilytica (strain DSM 15894 / JCM 12276 / CECT 5975 / KCTC 9989 / LMG 20990 / NBRC 107835 / XIL07) TaxID=446471 RepID=D1C0M0_XYLCX|nr:pyruvate dehydrogenase (acetyl-transferring) E1 component subunit alpha [Xylanimonas cellulosilytica]ACZ32223.1 pyruvate dehydrogenase (acetyl-transferring) E1 component, alpha subunit [Xylanimonas cellulosilytica DSM 15894]
MSDLATGEQGLLQLLDPAGVRTSTPENQPYRDRVAHLTADHLRAMYRDMVLTRCFDDEATALQRQGELALFAQARGQEAAQVGSAHALAPQDYVFPSYREHGVLHVRGVDPIDRLRLYRGEDHGGWDPREHNAHLYTLVLGSQVLHATGYAMGVQRDGLVGTGDPTRDTAVVAYFGDGTTSQGDVHEAMVFAAVNDAPTVFFLQNNQWAISEPTTRQAKVPLANRGLGYGIPSVRVDGNDVLACYAVTLEALERAHSGGGPTLIEAFTYRMGAHTTSDDPTRYRSREEEDYWRRRDPLDRLEAHLKATGAWDQTWWDGVEADAEALAARIRTETRELGAPPASAMFQHVYATPHATVADDAAWLAEYQEETAR